MESERYYVLRNKVTGEVLRRADNGSKTRSWKDPKPPALFWHPSSAYIARGARIHEVADPSEWEAVPVEVRFVAPIIPEILIEEP